MNRRSLQSGCARRAGWNKTQVGQGVDTTALVCYSIDKRFSSLSKPHNFRDTPSDHCHRVGIGQWMAWLAALEPVEMRLIAPADQEWMLGRLGKPKG